MKFDDMRPGTVFYAPGRSDMPWRKEKAHDNQPVPINGLGTQDIWDAQTDPGIGVIDWVVAWQPPPIERKQVIYVAHPISGDPIGNCLKVVQWIKWFTNNDPTRVYIAPYVAEVLAFPSVKSGDERWQRALNDDESVVSKLDGIVLVGGAITSGMQRELNVARAEQKYITDMSRYKTPDDLEDGFFMDPAYEL